MKTGLATGSIGCLISAAGIASAFVIGGLGVIFAPLVSLTLFSCGETSTDAPNTYQIVSIVRGGTRSDLASYTVSEEPEDPIKKADGLCPKIWLTARESGLQADNTGSKEELSLSRLPPDKLTRLSKSASELTSANDLTTTVEEALMRELAKQVKPLVKAKSPLNDVMSLNESHQYVWALRARSARYPRAVLPLPTTSPSQPATERQ